MGKIQMLNRSRVVIAHPLIDADADPSTLDVLDQVRLVEESLDALGIPWETVGISYGQTWEYTTKLEDVVVFNLLEAPVGSKQLEAAANAVFELLGIPFTGASASANWLTSNKLATRALLQAYSLPVAAGGCLQLDQPTVLERVPPPWIIKPAWEDASVGLEGNPVCWTPEQVNSRALALTARFPGQPILIEHFLPGREFNVSLLALENEVEVLPVAEMLFVDFPPDLPPLVNYEAKWETGSFAETHTVRRFPTQEEDGELLHRLQEMARRVWDVCELSGYARVDLRLDEAGVAHILEVNANPCLSADAGFMAAAAQAGLSAADVVWRILDAACGGPVNPVPTK